MSSLNVLVKRLEILDKQVRLPPQITLECAILHLADSLFFSLLLKQSSNKKKIPAWTNSKD